MFQLLVLCREGGDVSMQFAVTNKWCVFCIVWHQFIETCKSVKLPGIHILKMYSPVNIVIVLDSGHQV